MPASPLAERFQRRCGLQVANFAAQRDRHVAQPAGIAGPVQPANGF